MKNPRELKSHDSGNPECWGNIAWVEFLSLRGKFLGFFANYLPLELLDFTKVDKSDAKEPTMKI